MPQLVSLAAYILLALAACIEDQRHLTDLDATSLDTPLEPSDTALEPSDTTLDASDAASCSAPGMTRCAQDAAATEVCLDGIWQRAACAEGKICVLAGGAQCVESTGDVDCRDTLYCFIGCQVTHADDQRAADACFVNCFRLASKPSQRELSVVSTCFEDRCSGATGFACINESCSQDLAACYFDTTGTANCGAIIRCRLACTDPACERACGSDATFEAQGDYAVLELCTVYACVGQDSDCPRREALPTGTCGAYASQCMGILPGVTP